MASLLWMAGITLLLVPMATLMDVPIARWFLASRFLGSSVMCSTFRSCTHTAPAFS